MSDARKPTPAEMYERFFGPAIFVPWAKVLLEHAAPEPGERVLDLACGTGIVARHVAPHLGSEGEVIAVDISPDMLAVARSLPQPEGAKVDWRQGDARELPLPDDSVALVLCQQGLQFVPDRPAAVREMRRVLADGGRAVVSVWQGLDRHPVYRALLEAEARYLDAPIAEVAAPFMLGDEGELRALFADAGFERVEIIPKSLDVRFPTPERFVQLTLLAAAAVMPDFAQEDDAARAALVDAVGREVEEVLARHREGDHLVFPMPTHIVVAHT